MTAEGVLYIVSAPSGAGKTTLFKMALKYFSDLKPTISCTTRPIRENEKDGRDYFFISDKEFEEMIKENKFVEWANVHNYKYGTPYEFIEKHKKKGDDLLLDIDIQGAKKLKKLFPDSVLIFLLPPSLHTLQERLHKRMTNIKCDIKLRMENAASEIKGLNDFDYLIINDKLDKAFEDFKSVIVTHRLAKQRKKFDFEKFINS